MFISNFLIKFDIPEIINIFIYVPDLLPLINLLSKIKKSANIFLIRRPDYKKYPQQKNPFYGF